MFLQGDVLAVLATIKSETVQCVVTSPPYWGLRDYKVDGQIGLEKTPEAYTEKMVAVFREVRRVLRKDGTLWLNLGDSYAGSGKGGQSEEKRSENWQPIYGNKGVTPHGLKPKDLVGISWRVAFALQADGWWLRSDIIWAKPNPMPESVTDRPTKAHEYLFLLTKSATYYYDHEAIKEEGSMVTYKTPDGWDTSTGNGGHGSFHREGREKGHVGYMKKDKQCGHSRRHDGFNDRWDDMTKEEQCSLRVNKRTVWTIPPQPYPEAHFATFPERLVEPCILAGSKPGDIILDPFSGSGTTIMVANKFGRYGVGIELNRDYIRMAQRRIAEQPLSLGIA